MDFQNLHTTITADKAQKILAENGMQVSLEQSAAILDILLKFAQATLDAKDSRPLYQSKYRRAS
jgi:hypothetical protein